jgi:hypothetical protein
MTPEQSYSVITLLNDIKKLLEKQNELLENQQTNTQTKITVVGNKVASNNTRLDNSEDFIL